MSAKRRLFYAELATETNTFSAIPTTLESFQVRRGDAVLNEAAMSAVGGSLFEDLTAKGFEVIVSLSASAHPGAATQDGAYEALKSEILEDLRRAMPVDAVLLSLHGAMVAQSTIDCEGDILSAVRALVGPSVPIGSVLDPHAHLTPTMVEQASILAFMKEYPHTDGLERARDVVRVLLAMLDDGLVPHASVFDCRLLGFFPTQNQPMRGFVDEMTAMEQTPGVLSISFVHGFPWGDTPHTGAKVLVYTAADADLGARIAQDLHERIWAIRDQTLPDFTPLETAVARMRQPHARPLVVADFADNPGGGAPADSTYLLRAMLDAGVTGAAIGLMCDPEATRLCHAVGLGGRLELRIGGKLGRASGQPVDLEVEVMGLQRDAMMDVLGLAQFPMGDTAWVRGADIDIVLNTERIQMYDASGFSHLGLDPQKATVLVVKSSNHFYMSFSKLSDEILYVPGPGALDLSFKALPYKYASERLYPRIEDPFAPD